MIGNLSRKRNSPARHRPAHAEYALSVQFPLVLRRQGYRSAHALLRLYWFVRRPSMHGVKCVLTDGDQVLLVRHTYGHRSWDFPGGGVRRGEQPLSAARREMMEELGIRIDAWAELGELWASIHHRHDTMHLFQAELQAPGLEINAAELAEARWFPARRLPPDVGRYVGRILARAKLPDSG